MRTIGTSCRLFALAYFVHSKQPPYGASVDDLMRSTKPSAADLGRDHRVETILVRTRTLMRVVCRGAAAVCNAFSKGYGAGYEYSVAASNKGLILHTPPLPRCNSVGHADGRNGCGLTIDGVPGASSSRPLLNERPGFKRNIAAHRQ